MRRLLQLLTPPSVPPTDDDWSRLWELARLVLGSWIVVLVLFVAVLGRRCP